MESGTKNARIFCYTTTAQLCITAPWPVALGITLDGADPTLCDPNTWNNVITIFWMYLALLTYILLKIPMELRIIHVARVEERRSRLYYVASLLTALYSLTVLAIFILVITTYDNNRCDEFAGLLLTYIIVNVLIVALACLIPCILLCLLPNIGIMEPESTAPRTIKRKKTLEDAVNKLVRHLETTKKLSGTIQKYKRSGEGELTVYEPAPANLDQQGQP